MNEDNIFTEKVKALDALILAYKPYSEGLWDGIQDDDGYEKDYEEYWNRDISPNLNDIRNTFSALAFPDGDLQIQREDLVFGFGKYDNIVSYQDSLHFYPTDGKNAFIRLGRYILEESVISIGSDYEKIITLVELHKNPIRRNQKTALAALYVKLESAAIAEESPKEARTDPNAKGNTQTPQLNGESLPETKSDTKARSYGEKWTHLYPKIFDYQKTEQTQAAAIRKALKEDGKDEQFIKENFERVRKAYSQSGFGDISGRLSKVG